MHRQAQAMKNKSKQQTQLELIRKLLGVVNSTEELSYLKAEEVRLSSFFSQFTLGEYQLNKLRRYRKWK